MTKTGGDGGDTSPPVLVMSKKGRILRPCRQQYNRVRKLCIFIDVCLSTLKAGVCGLCGDFNGDAQNDFTTQSQIVVSSPLEFANSWKASSSCLDAEASADSCSLQPHRHSWAQLQCGIIKSDTFKDCHKKVS